MYAYIECRVHTEHIHTEYTQNAYTQSARRADTHRMSAYREHTETPGPPIPPAKRISFKSKLCLRNVSFVLIL